MAGFTYLLGVDLGAAWAGTTLEVRLRDKDDAAVAFADDVYSKQHGENGTTIIERDGGRFSVHCTEWPTTFPYSVVIFDAGSGDPIPGAVVDFNRQDFAETTVGSGALPWSYTLTNSEDDTPIAGADVWVATDEEGGNVVARGTTDTFGVVTFYLDAGDYYVFRAHPGFTFDNPDTETVA